MRRTVFENLLSARLQLISTFPFYLGKAVPATNYRFIDVRDVASAHIQAFEVPSATGRYCLVSHTAHISEALEIIQQLYPTLHIPER